MKKVNKNVEKKFTLEQAVEELKAKEEAKQIDRKERITRFVELIQKAEEETGCYLQVDLDSTLNNIKIIPLSKT